MPSNVVLFERLMYLAIAVGIGNSVIQDRASTPALSKYGLGPAVAAQALGVLIIALFIWLIARRHKNWARWVWLICFVVGLPFAYPAIAAEFRVNVVTAYLSIVGWALQFAALCFIFTGDARDWFRARYQ